MICRVKSLFSKNEPTATNHSVRLVCRMIEPAGSNNFTDSCREELKLKKAENDVNTFIGKLKKISVNVKN